MFLPEKRYRLVDGGDAGRRELGSDRVVDLLDAGVPIAGGQHLQHRQPLRGDPEIVVPELREHLVQALVG
jgi:hypothetical protein